MQKAKKKEETASTRSKSKTRKSTTRTDVVPKILECRLQTGQQGTLSFGSSLNGKTLGASLDASNQAEVTAFLEGLKNLLGSIPPLVQITMPKIDASVTIEKGDGDPSDAPNTSSGSTIYIHHIVKITINGREQK